MIHNSTYSFTGKLFLFWWISLLSAFQIISAQAPIIASFNPASGPVGTSVVISGSGFSAIANENIVFFGATQAAVTTASTTSLTVTVPVGATYETISVLNSVNTLTGYSLERFVTTFTPSNANISFEGKIDFATNNNANNVLINDVDGDGKADIILLSTAASKVSVLRNTATSGAITAGSFAANVDFNVQANSFYLAIRDLDGDGKPDLVVTSNTAGVTVFLNTSSGAGNINFGPGTQYTANTGTDGIAINDFDGDGKPDLIVTNHTSNNISVFRNLSSGIGNVSFAAKVDFTTGSFPDSIAIGDYDGDGKADIAVTNKSAATMSVFRNISTGIGNISFSGKVDFPAGIDAFNIVMGDFNNDGKPDLANVNVTGATVSVFRNISSGTGNISFDPKINLTTGAQPRSVAVADLNGDGKVDLIALNQVGNSISAFRNTSVNGGAVSFAAKTDFAAGPSPFYIVTGDLDGDGKSDVAVANNNATSLSVFRNNLLNAPAIQAVNVTFTATSGTTTTASWTNGNGSSRAVFIYAGASGSPLPLDNITYTANTAFGTGTQIGTTGWYCVYNGTGTTVNISGLTPATTYKVMTVEYNGSSGTELYLSTVSTGNPAGVTTLNNIATLSNLSMSVGTLAPVFATGTASYTATVVNTVTNLTVTPTTTDSNATVTVNGVAVTSGSASVAIALAVGSNTITTEVTAQDGTTIQTYTIVVTRAAAPPVITNFSPQNGPVGTTVIITGTGFNATAAQNIVFFGAVQATVSLASITSLTVTVPAGTTYSSLSVVNGATVLVGYSAMPFVTTFTPNKGNITIDDIMPPVDFNTNGANYGLAVGDFDSDGKADLAVVNRDSNSVSVLLNTAVNGSITASSFAAKIDFPLGSAPRGIRIGDFDCDGKIDIAATNSGGNSVSILRNISTGIGTINFAAKADFSVGLGAVRLSVEDFDGDGRIDIATANFNDNTVSVLQNISSGSGNVNFAPQATFSVGNKPLEILAGDMDGDNKLDLVVANTVTKTISVFRNTSTIGTVNFAPKVDFLTTKVLTYGALGDLNKDGKIDIVICNETNNSISTYRNTSTGIGNINFDTNVDFSVPNIQIGVAIGDLDGDGNADLAVTNNVNVSVLRNISTPSGPINFANTVNFTTAATNYEVVMADIDGDGKNDLISTHNSGSKASVFRNNPLFAPTVQAIDVVFTATTGTTTTASWTNGNGSARAVFMYVGATGSSLPVDYTTYTANAVFGTGTQIGTTGWYCVYNGTGSTVNITGLTPATAYQVMTVEYNGSAANELYLSTISTGNPAGVTTLNNVATLSNLSISQGTLDPIFATGTSSYTTTVANAVTSLTITPTTTDTNATVMVNSTAVISGNASDAITLAVGSNTITTVVTAQDGTTTEIYTITVMRTAPATIVSTGTLSALTAIYGTASASGSFNVLGTDMLAGIFVSPPPGFEVSTDNVTFTNTVIVGTAGTILDTPVYIRLKGNIIATSYSGDVILTSTGANTVNVATVTSTVNPAVLTITAVDADRGYGDANPTFTSVPTGFVNGDTSTIITTAATVGTTATTASAVGTYPITPSGAVVSANYTISYVDGTLTVTQAVLTITVDDKTKIYGDANPTLTASYAGFVNGDTSADLTTQPTITTTAVTGSDAGNYPITAGGAVAANYTITYGADGTLTVTPVVLTITADNQTKGYGDVNPTLTAAYAGFVNGDTSADLTTLPTITTTAVTGSDVGTYPITAGGAVSSNYTITYGADGILIVTPVTLTITADNQTKAYGVTNPVLTASYTGFVNGDTSADLTTLPTITTIATTASDVGNYPITAGGAVSSNYAINYGADGTLTVTQVALTITADNQTKAYGVINPVLTASYTGFVNGDTSADLTTQPTITTTAVTASDAGTYPITAGGAVSSNYAITYGADGILTVTAVALIVTADNQTKAYGDANPVLTVSYAGFVNGDTSANLTTQPAITTTAVTGSDAGTYPITAGGAVSSNYTITYGADGTLTVTPVALTITTDNQTKAYGDANPVLTASYTGFVNGDTSANLTTQPAITTTAVTSSNAGTYPITAGGAVSSNYTITYGADGTLTVTQVVLTITPVDNSKAYGDANPVLTANYTGFVNSDTETNLTTLPTITTTAVTGSNVGTYPITISGAVSANYTINYGVDGTLTITPVVLTITANNQIKTYGDANPILTASYTGFVNGDTAASLTTAPSLTTTAVTASPVGTYPITASGAAAVNYTIAYVNGTLTVSTATLILSITAENKTKAYGSVNPPLTVTYTGFVNGDTSADLTTQPTITTTAVTSSPVGTYPITAVGAASPNYIINNVDGILTITPVNLTIKIDDLNKGYGDVNPTLTASYLGFVNGDTSLSLTTQLIITTTATTSSAVGIYPITASGALSINYTISYVDGTLTVAPAALTITADNQSKIYGDANPTLTAAYAGFVNGDTSANLTTLPAITTTAVTGSGAGTYPITAGGAVSPNYTITYGADGTLTVTPAALTITADDKSKAYGDANPTLTAVYTGFVNGDTSADLTALPTITTTAVTASDAGTYPITAGGAVSSNYTITYGADGTLTVTPVTLTITADNQTKAYGDANPVLTESYTGFVNGDTSANLTTLPTITTTATTVSNVGTYPISVGGAVSSNYTITYGADGTLTVTPVALTITADDKSKAYGDANPTLTAAYTGFVNGDTSADLTTLPTITTTAVTGSDVGAYPITAGDAVSANYTITYGADGTLTVTPVTLTITADNQTKVYGDANPVLTASYAGFVNGDTSADLTTLPTITTTAVTASDAGNYPITAADAVSSNYTIGYGVDGTLTVTPAALSITADDKSKIYGDANPVLTASYSGFVNGDTSADLTIQPVITTTAVTGSGAGSYPITASGAVATNYTITYGADGTLTVTPVALTITADDKSKVYGDVNPVLTASYTGFVNGDTSANLTTLPTITTTAVTGSNAGTYPITAGGAVSSNYTITYGADGTLTVTPVALTITADDKSKVYGDANPVLTASYSGFANGDTSANLTTLPTITTTAITSSDVGNYPITAGGAVSLNYTISYGADGTLTVTPVALTITADNQTKAYGDTNPILTASYTGFANGDTSADLTTLPTITTTAITGSDVGNYPITAGGAVSSNYTITYGADGTLTVTPVALTITADNQSKVYGDANPVLTASYAGFVNGDTSTGLTTQPTLTTTALTGSNVGTYPITAGGAVSSNYTITYGADGILTVIPIALTITADDKSKVYGDVNPVLTVSYTGFANGDTSADLTTLPTITTTAITGSDVGNYPITAGGAVSSNYTITYGADGTLTVTSVALTITADNQSKVYGDANPVLTVSYSGFVNGDTSANLTTLPTITTTAVTGSDTGTYPITAGGAVSANYTITYGPDGALTVTPVPLTITADNKVKDYGAVNPVLTASYTGFVNGDTSADLTTLPTITTTAVTGSHVGMYPITASGAVSVNYVITYGADAALTVNPVALTITADNKVKDYEAVNPVLTVSYTGFVNGDSETSLAALPTISTTAVTTSPIGTYPITASSAASSNYAIAYVEGTLTVTAITNANLSNLAISNGTLNPAFSADVILYNVTVENNVAFEVITPTTEDPLAAITVNGAAVTSGSSSGPITLSFGQNTIIVQVTASDGITTKAYTVTIVKAASSEAGLSNLSISSGTLTPAFASNITNYDAAVQNSVSSITVTPSLIDPTAAIKINGAAVSNNENEAVPLNVGDNTITVEVTAQDGTTKETYTIHVYRAVGPEAVVATNILSPNGDGKNDYWEIQDINLYPNNKVTVYDRAGRIVYSKNNYNNEWEGSYQGSPLNNETYYYLIDFGPDLPKRKGFITITRY